MNAGNKKYLIVKAFIEMAKTQPVESIRIGDLISRTCISRATFYRLFQNKYDVMTCACLMVTDSMVSEYPELPIWELWIRIMLEHVKANQEYYRNIVFYRGHNSFYAFMVSYFIRNSLAYIAQKNGKGDLSEEMLFALEAFANVDAFAVYNWIANNCEPEIDTLCAYVKGCIPVCLREFYQG